LAKIILGILFSLLVPVAVKILVLKPVFGLINPDEQISKTIQGFITIGIILASYHYFSKKFENREIRELSKAHFIKDNLTGFATGFALISLVAGIMYLFGYYLPVSINNPTILFKPLMIFCIMGVWEEIIFRGIIYRITEESLGTIRALLISSFIFGFVHFSNSGFNWISGPAIALSIGLLTGILYTLSGRLWMSISLHIGWNISFVFWGMTVSGAQEFPSFIESRLTGPDWISGGKFGPENSLLTVFLSIILFSFFYFLALRSGKIRPSVAEKLKTMS